MLDSFKVPFFIISIFFYPLVALSQGVSIKDHPHPRLEGYLLAIRQESDPGRQDDLAANLVDYVRHGLSVRYSPVEVDEIAQLLQDSRVTARYWIADALGVIGPDARRAAPYLQAAFAEALCKQVAAHVRRRYGIYAINSIEGNMLGLGINPQPALCPSGPEPDAPLLYYDDPVLQQYLEVLAPPRNHAARPLRPPPSPAPGRN